MNTKASDETLWNTFFDSVSVEVKGQQVTIPAELMENCHEAAYETATFGESRPDIIDKCYALVLQRSFDQLVRARSAAAYIVHQIV